MKTNLFSNLKLFTLGLAGILSLASCSKDEDNNTPAPKSIAEIVNTDANFSLLKAAVEKAGLGTALSSGTLTVFAPDNSAFAEAGIDLALINAASTGFIDSVLKYHVVGAKVLSTGVPASDTVKSLLGTNLYASKNSNGVFVNGIKVKAADVTASNGVIHVISNVLIPPTKNIAELVSADADLSSLLGLVAGYGLVPAVSGSGKLTVFAPTNAAFSAITSLPDTATVIAILTSHIIGTNVFASDLINGDSAKTLNNNFLLIGLNPASVKIKTSSAPVSNITAADIIATNGVIHKIDRVLLP